MIRLLDTGTESYRTRVPLPESESLQLQIHNLNRATGIRTDMKMRTGKETKDCPVGLGVYTPPDMYHELEAGINKELVRIFSLPDKELRDKFHAQTRGGEFSALFWQKKKAPAYKLNDVMDTLAPVAPMLVELIRDAYVPLIAKVLQLDPQAVLSASAEVIHYKPRCSGLMSHIDNVYRADGNMGPICSVSFITERDIDMLPVFVPNAKPLRVHTDPGDMIVMDSDARVLWSHSVPFGVPHHRYSLIIRPIRHAGKKNRGISPFDTVIPTETF